MQPEFTSPDFTDGSTAEEIHARMMENLPDDLDTMPGGFPYDMTMPAALEKEEFINYHLIRALMIGFPEYAWDEWLDLHGKQVHLTRHEAVKASGRIRVTGIPETVIEYGTVFCTLATESGPSIGFSADEECEIGSEGTAEVPVSAVTAGSGSNVKARTVTLMERPVKGITQISNPEAITGGQDRESDDDFYDRISAEYENSLSYLGNDSDYIRWAKEAGAGGCVVAADEKTPGVVTLVLTDRNGMPADETLIQAVYDYIVSPDDRSRRLLPTGSAKLVCRASTVLTVNYICTGLVFDSTVTSLSKIKKDFGLLVKAVYASAQEEGVLRYNDVRPLMNQITGVEDFASFLMNGAMENILMEPEQYADTGTLDFGQEA